MSNRMSAEVNQSAFGYHTDTVIEQFQARIELLRHLRKECGARNF